MRQYSFGVLLIIFGQLSSVTLSKNPDKKLTNRDPSFVLEVPDNTNDRVISEEKDRDGLNLLPGENKVQLEDPNPYTDEDINEDYEFGTDQVMDDETYWKTIYGDDDVPDFDVPPPIDGESIFLDFSEMEDFWNDQNDEEAVPVKRNAGKTLAVSSLQNHRRNLKNTRRYQNSDYHNIMTNVRQPQFHEQDSWGHPQTSSTFRNNENIQFYGSEGSSGTISLSDHDQRESAKTSENVRRLEHGNGRPSPSEDVDSEMEGEVESAEQYPVTLKSKSIKSGGKIDSLLNSKLKIIQAKKDLIKTTVTGGSEAEVSGALHRTIGAKKDLIDSVISSKTGVAHAKKEFIHSLADFDNDRSYSTNTRTSGSTHSPGNIQAVLDSKQRVIQAKKDFIHAAVTGGSEAEVSGALHRTIGAKKDLIDSVITSKAGVAHAKKEFIHSLADFDHDQSYSKKSRISGLLHSQNDLQSFIDSKRKVIKAKKDLIDAAAAGDSKAELTDAVIKTLDAKKELVDSVISTKSEMIHNKKEFAGHSTCCGRNTAKISFGRVHGTKVTSLNTNSQRNGKIYVNPREGSIASSRELDSTTSASDSSSEEIKDSTSTEIQSGNKFSGYSNAKRVSKAEIAKNVEIKSSVNSKVQLGTNLGLKDAAQSGFHIKSTINSDLSAHSETVPILDEKSILDNGKGSAALKVTEIVETQWKDKSQSARKECATGECGISGKLHGHLNTNSESNFRQKTQLETLTESDISKNIDDSKDVGEIPKFDVKILDTKEVEHDRKYAEEENHTESEEENEYLEAIEDQESQDDTEYIEKQHFEGKDVIAFTKNVQVDALTKSDESESNSQEKLENTDNELKRKLEAETEEDSVDITKSDEALHLNSKYSQAQENMNKAMDENMRYKVSVKISKSQNKSSHGHFGSTYEEKFGKHYSNAAQHHRVSQKTEEHSNFQFCDGFFLTHIDENPDYLLKDDETFSNAHCRLINLDVNCSGMTAFMRPECQQLNTNLWHPRDSGTPINLWTVKRYMSHGQELAIEMQNRAKWLCGKGFIPKLHTPAMLHLINNLATENTVEINHESELSLFGTKLLQRRLLTDFDVTPNTFVEFLQHHALRVIGTGLCRAREKRCPVNQIYRSFDGSCNNPNHPTWGQSNTAFSRILPARYSDGVHEPPKSVTGNELPNPRVISVNCFSRTPTSDVKLTLAVAQWGQILSHDFALQTIDQTVEGGIECCADGKQLPKKLQHHSCLPIDIPDDDKFYSKFKTRCMNFVRSMTISKEDCTLGPADQLNTVTSYLDASPLYGSNKETCDKLRAFKGGRMLVTIHRGRELLPTTNNRSRFCDVMSPTEMCYFAGDVRVNQNPHLAIIQTIFLREHNKIADMLVILNPHWEEERVFQETRRLVIAIYQHITYNEWLPLIIGKKYCRKYRLTPERCRNKNMSRDYDPKIKSATINSFTTAAFRYFHSLIDGNINLCPANREISHTLRLSNHYFRPQIIERSNNLDDLIRGLVSQPMKKADENFHPEITEYLFRSTNEFGLDLESFDIQRGRDHGLRGYNAYRKICGLNKARDFDDLIKEIPYEKIKMLQEIYAHVDDIDLIVGIVMEKKCSASIFGPVGRCIVGEQFYRSKIGDRYFYNSENQPHPFTQEQFEEITKTSFARLLCETGDDIEKIQPQAFKMISSSNPLTCCSALPKLDLSAWQELLSQ